MPSACAAPASETRPTASRAWAARGRDGCRSLRRPAGRGQPGGGMAADPAAYQASASPTHTQSGRTFRLRGKGMPKLKNPSQQGDLFVKVRVRLPKKLNKREKELFRELADLRH